LKVTGREILDVHLAYSRGTSSNSSKGIIPGYGTIVPIKLIFANLGAIIGDSNEWIYGIMTHWSTWFDRTLINWNIRYSCTHYQTDVGKECPPSLTRYSHSSNGLFCLWALLYSNCASNISAPVPMSHSRIKGICFLGPDSKNTQDQLVILPRDSQPKQ